jgi:hypothetical protein
MFIFDKIEGGKGRKHESTKAKEQGIDYLNNYHLPLKNGARQRQSNIGILPLKKRQRQRQKRRERTPNP